MTAKQRAARAKFKAVVKEASKLRKKNPKLTQAEAVKQAWAISYSKKRKGEKLGYSKEREKLHKNATAWLKKRKKIDEDKSKKDRVSLAYQQAPFGKPGVGAIKKKSATKVKAKKSKRTSEMHTDTKSHNVNIKVVSGTQTDIVSKYVKANQDIEKLERALIRNKETLKQPPYKTDFWKKYISDQNKKIKKYISELKKHKAELKKLM